MTPSTREKDTQQLSVALLLDDLQDAKAVSQVFRKIGVVPHFYEDLASFWEGTLEAIPSFCLVDIKKMSEGDLRLRQHPYILNEQLPIGFFYNEESKPLLYSTFDLFHLGLVRSTGSLKGQIKSILKRLNRMMEVEFNSQSLHVENQKLEKQVNRFVTNVETYKEEQFYRDLLEKICQQFELERGQGDLFTACEKVFSSWSEVDKFSCLELSPNGQKLISPISAHPKFKTIPSIWLGQTCREGIEFFAQNMASQVCVDLMGGELMSLNIRGRHQSPDMIFMLKLNDRELMDNFDWEKLERYLSGLAAHFQLINQVNLNEEGRTLQPWDLMSVLDSHTFSSEITDSSTYALIDIDFSSLVELIRTKTHRRFYWKTFYHEFVTRLSTRKKIDFQVICMSVDHLGLLVSRDQADELFQFLKGYVLRFSYWRYFEDGDLMFCKDVKPSLRMVPFSSTAYLSFLDGSHPLVDEKKLIEQARVKTQRLIWGEAPTQSM